MNGPRVRPAEWTIVKTLSNNKHTFVLCECVLTERVVYYIIIHDQCYTSPGAPAHSITLLYYTPGYSYSGVSSFSLSDL